MAVQPAARGFTAVCIQSQERTGRPHATGRDILSWNGALPGLQTGVFYITGPRRIRRGVRGRSAKSICGGMRSSKSGQATIYRTSRSTGPPTTDHNQEQQAWMLSQEAILL